METIDPYRKINRKRGHESILVGSFEGGSFGNRINVKSVIGMMEVRVMTKCYEWNEGEGGWGEKFSNLRYKGGTCTKMSHEQEVQTNSNTRTKSSKNSQVFVTSTEVLDTFVTVTVHKQVCANQQSLHVSCKALLNHKQASGALFFSLTRIWVGFLARGLHPRCWSLLAVTGFSSRIISRKMWSSIKW